MLAQFRARLTFANVTSVLALFVALGGTGAYATHEVINSSDVVDGSLQRQDLANGAVSTAKILDATVGAADLRTGAVNNARLADNAVTGIKVLDNPLSGLDIDESSLGKVPDADKVDGLDSSELQQAELVQFGAGTETASTTQPVINWLELASFQTDGDTDADGTVMICNTGSQVISVIDSVGAQAAVNVGFCSSWPANPPTTFIVWSWDGARSWLVSCARTTEASAGGAFSIRCHGEGSRGG